MNLAWILLVLTMFSCKEDTMKQVMREATTRNVLVETDSQLGSGVILETGLVLTNLHILEVGSDIKVGGKLAEIMAISTKQDLMLLRVETAEVTPVKIGIKYELGDEVLSIGNPTGIIGVISKGIISHIESNIIFTDTVLVSGGSGGGLYNMKGELIGINQATTKKIIAMHIRSEVILFFLRESLK